MAGPREVIGRFIASDMTLVDPDQWADFDQAINTLIKALDDAGFVVVPREPTEAMVEAARAHDIQACHSPEAETVCWQAMINAAATE